ncbi:sensory neuron membrane protein 1-like [Drosophila navojoa]|uniref:sensory neuron membrane protein 1-like n=1 Tax=Drosophila navojoa TaxID=7232 RepID=UPI0011BEC551|nr:sensory neuron membrane protein 1-like [Drosophila navojoa]
MKVTLEIPKLCHTKCLKWGQYENKQLKSVSAVEVKMYLKVMIVSFVIVLLGALIGFLAFPMIFKQLIKRSVNLKPGSETRQLWEKMPFPLSFKIYVFNVTNSVNIEAGGKPQLEEVGPFVYE